MRKKLKFISLLFLLGIFSLPANATRRFWIGAVSNSWKNTANWSATSGGTGGASIPGSNDTAAFNGVSTIHRCNLDTLVNVKRLSISGDTLSQGAYTITLGSTGGNLTGGVFLGGSAAISTAGAFTIAGTTFTSTSATFSISASFTFTSGSFAHNNGKLLFSATNTITGSITLYALEFAPSSTAVNTIASGTTLTVNNTLTISGAASETINTGAISAKGNITITNSSTTGTGTATITINGTGTQTLTGTASVGEGKLPNIIINKSSSDTLKLEGIISIYGNWTYTAGIINSGSSTIHFANTQTITGSHALYNVNFSGGAARVFTIAAGTILTINGTMATTAANTVTINTGTIYAKGNISITNSASGAAGSASLVINGTASQTLTGSGTAGLGVLPKITIDKTSDTLHLASIITVNGDWIYTQGEVAPHTSTVVLNGNANLDGQITAGSTLMSFYTLAISGTITLTGNIDVDNNLSIGNGATLTAGSNDIHIGGQWNNTTGTWNYGTGTVIFDGSTYKQIKKTISGAVATETFYNLSFNRGGGSQTLGSPVVVNNVLTLTKGHVKSTTANYLTLIDNATLIGGSDSAYVHGPVRKTGDDAFVFPLGDTTLSDSSAYHPLGMSAPASTTDQFEGTYFAIGQTVGDSLVDSLGSISTCEYWTINRIMGSSAPTVSVSWNKNSCNVEDYSDLRMAQWNGTMWLDLDVASVTVADYQGIVTGSITPGYSINPVPILIGRRGKTYEYAQLKKKLDGGYYQAINGRLFFRYDEEYNDADGYLTFNIYEDQKENVFPPITSNNSLPPAIRPHVVYGTNYYRLNTIQCNFTNTGGTLPNGFYILEVINEKNEHWYLRFKNYSVIDVVCGYPPN
ncbi:hypothetical protein BH11BAC7_BH11BAC7_32930 [soil metagenome]